MRTPDIDPMTPFDKTASDEDETVRLVFPNGEFIAVRIGRVQRRLYATPLRWDDANDCYHELTIKELIASEGPPTAIHRWSMDAETILLSPGRDEPIHLRIPGIANLNHTPGPPRRTNKNAVRFCFSAAFLYVTISLARTQYPLHYFNFGVLYCQTAPQRGRFAMAKDRYDKTDQFLQQYIDFCQSPLRSTEDIKADLQRLSTSSMVKMMAFADEAKIPSTLMIGLRPLIIRDPKTQKDHFIGNFIVYITRYRDYPVWIADFNLVNLNPVYVQGAPEYFHPHMIITENMHIGAVAYICIQQRQYPIIQYIRKGQLDLAMELIIILLHSLGPNAPFKPIGEWPLAHKRKERPWFIPKMRAR